MLVEEQKQPCPHVRVAVTKCVTLLCDKTSSAQLLPNDQSIHRTTVSLRLRSQIEQLISGDVDSLTRTMWL